jgi:flavin reductase (DIM6/NTAB) family NADH-FMN oxidoreductase RutF
MEMNNLQTDKWMKIDPKYIQDNPVSLFGQEWVALATGNKDKMNAMTIGWGTLGSLWLKPVVTVYVSPSRYTHSLMEDNDYFTLTAFPEQYRETMVYIGSHSGRDTNKIKNSGLTVEYTELGNPYFTEARLILECRKIYSHQFDTSKLGDVGQAIYKTNGMKIHHEYIGEIINAWIAL